MRPLTHKEKIQSCRFLRGNHFMHPSCIGMPRLLKQMVMRLLCNTNMMYYILCEQIYPSNLFGNVFSYIHKEKKLKFVDFCVLTILCAQVASRCHIFKINGHEASMQYQYNVLHIV